MERWKSGPLKRARRTSCSGEDSRSRLCCRGPKSWSMVTDQRMAHIGQTEGISRFLTDERCFSAGPRLTLRMRTATSNGGLNRGFDVWEMSVVDYFGVGCPISDDLVRGHSPPWQRRGGCATK